MLAIYITIHLYLFIFRWGREDPLEKEVATHSRMLAWEIPRTEEPGL